MFIGICGLGNICFEENGNLAHSPYSPYTVHIYYYCDWGTYCRQLCGLCFVPGPNTVSLRLAYQFCFRRRDGYHLISYGLVALLLPCPHYLSTARKHGHSLLYSLERVFAGKLRSFQTTDLVSAT